MFCTYLEDTFTKPLQNRISTLYISRCLHTSAMRGSTCFKKFVNSNSIHMVHVRLLIFNYRLSITRWSRKLWKMRGRRTSNFEKGFRLIIYKLLASLEAQNTRKHAWRWNPTWSRWFASLLITFKLILLSIKWPLTSCTMRYHLCWPKVSSLKCLTDRYSCNVSKYPIFGCRRETMFCLWRRLENGEERENFRSYRIWIQGRCRNCSVEKICQQVCKFLVLSHWCRWVISGFILDHSNYQMFQQVSESKSRGRNWKEKKNWISFVLYNR